MKTGEINPPPNTPFHHELHELTENDPNPSRRRVTVLLRVIRLFISPFDLSYISLSSSVIYPSAPTSFEDVIELVPPRGTSITYRFICAEKPFQLCIGRNSMNIVWLEFCTPDAQYQFWPCIRRVESLTTQRSIWFHWQKFLADPDDYLTWKYIGADPQR